MPRLILALFLCAVFYFFFENNWHSKSSFSDVQVDLNISGLHLGYGQGGEKKFIVRAVSGQFIEPEDRIVLQQLVMLFGNEKESPIEVRAPHGEIKRQEGRAVLGSPVQGNWGMVRLQARHLTYDSRKETVWLRGAVQASSPGFSLVCRQIELLPKSGQMRAKGGVEVLFPLPDQG